ncbi:SMC-Scp complex subunit ScpB [Deferribacterales bacterium Es71-Z0220]|jgi:segregation and condensation protein B|uniref:SMC-Scp complex subunit ScpB n=1 Tax=Deferrivibrio essentukiensis TaxID=2880922 RepID=UPI001F6151FC|nr:SMC-Scp complex subunit ScpB [Deferrivibrio essentukiensis]MBZ4671982.1 chromosome segregation and condensation protein ScpB [Deferribacteraceae bacterium]MCB4204148.1 SMC-Scp complex subunit ScpB [Deferrivibrio essentukiensis]
MDNKEKKIFYASLFLSGKPLSKTFFVKISDNPINLENRLTEYIKEFNELELGLRIRTVSDGYQMVTESNIFDELAEFFGEKGEALSRAALETLAAIAYKQPITKNEIEDLRGVNSSGIIKNLLDRNFIKVVGRKDVPGRPLLYCTTKEFLEYFGLNSLSDLPTFREWQELKNNK